MRTALLLVAVLLFIVFRSNAQVAPGETPGDTGYVLSGDDTLTTVRGAYGKQLRVLQEANLEAGQYQYEWQTSELSPGIYYVTLRLDGKPIVKKAVKVQRWTSTTSA